MNRVRSVVTDPCSSPIRANDWREYRSLAQLEDHWNLQAWGPGYAAYYWHLSFSEEALVALVRRCQARLDSTHLSMVPLDGLHVTLVKVGAAENIATSAVPRFVTTAQVIATRSQRRNWAANAASCSSSELLLVLVPSAIR